MNPISTRSDRIPIFKRSPASSFDLSPFHASPFHAVWRVVMCFRHAVDIRLIVRGLDRLQRQIAECVIRRRRSGFAKALTSLRKTSWRRASFQVAYTEPFPLWARGSGLKAAGLAVLFSLDVDFLTHATSRPGMQKVGARTVRGRSDL